MKIAHLYQESGIQFHRPQAAQLHIYHTIHGLQQAGHQVKLVALQGRQVLCTDDLQVFQTAERQPSQYARLGLSGTAAFRLFESGVRRLQPALRLPYLALFDSYRLAEAARLALPGYDVLHERFNLLALGGLWASRRLGLPWVLEVNADQIEQRRFKGVPETGLRGRFARWATAACFRGATKIICISADLQRHLEQRWKVPPDKLVVLPCAADIDAFAPNGSAQPVRRQLGLGAEPVVMWIGGFYPWHDLDLLLQSFAQVVQHRPDARLVLVGDGPTFDSVASQVQANGLQGAVTLTGAVDHSRMPELLSIADVAVVPAVPIPASQGGTGTPLKLFEYMAAGKAIVATALNQSTEVLQHNTDGLLVAAGDHHGFAQAIVGLLNDPAQRQRLGHNARRRAVEQFSWGAYTRQLETLYHTVLGPASGRAQGRAAVPSV